MNVVSSGIDQLSARFPLATSGRSLWVPSQMSLLTAQLMWLIFSVTPLMKCIAQPRFHQLSALGGNTVVGHVRVPPYSGAVTILPVDGSSTISFSVAAADSSSAPAAQRPVAVKARPTSTARNLRKIASCIFGSCNSRVLVPLCILRPLSRYTRSRWCPASVGHSPESTYGTSFDACAHLNPERRMGRWSVTLASVSDRQRRRCGLRMVG